MTLREAFHVLVRWPALSSDQPVLLVRVEFVNAMDSPLANVTLNALISATAAAPVAVKSNPVGEVMSGEVMLTDPVAAGPLVLTQSKVTVSASAAAEAPTNKTAATAARRLMAIVVLLR